MSKTETELSLYDILGVAPSASPDDIRRAFRIAVKQHHPDVGGSREMFEAIQNAYEILFDEKERRRYDAARKILEGIDQEEKPDYLSYNINSYAPSGNISFRVPSGRNVSVWKYIMWTKLHLRS